MCVFVVIFNEIGRNLCIFRANMVEIPEIVTRTFFKIFWVILPMALLFALLMSLQCALNVWRSKAKNTSLKMWNMHTVLQCMHPHTKNCVFQKYGV